MSKVLPPPIYEPVIQDASDPVASVPWVLFFNQLYNGDTGSDWKPNFVNLAVTGTPQITGRIYQISRSLVFFSARIIPSTNSTATAGSTYIDNFPFRMRGDGIVFAVSGLLGTNSGQCEQATNRIYVPSWSAVTVPLSLVGIVEAV